MKHMQQPTYVSPFPVCLLLNLIFLYGNRYCSVMIPLMLNVDAVSFWFEDENSFVLVDNDGCCFWFELYMWIA